VADPAVQGRSLLLDAIRVVAVACRAWEAYPPAHPTVLRAIETAYTRLAAALATLGPVALGVARTHLRAGVWTLNSPQACALAQALYRRQVATVQIDAGLTPAELRALVAWLGGPAVPLEPGAPVAGVPGMPTARHLHIQPVDYSVIRLVDDTAAPLNGSVSLADRLLNILLESSPADRAWGLTDEPAGTGGPSPEAAIVAWLKEFLEAQAALARAEGQGRAGEPRDPGGREGPSGLEGAGRPGGPPGQGPRRPGVSEGPGGPRAAGGPRVADAPSPDAAPTLQATPAEPAGGSPDSAAAPRAPAGQAPGQSPPAPEAGTGVAVPEPPPGPVPGRLAARLADTTTRHLAALSGAGRVLAARQTAQIILGLPGSLRESLVRAALRTLAEDPDGEEALLALTGPLGAHPVLRALRQLATDGAALSRHAQRLVELLASARSGDVEDESAPPPALEALRTELIALFREEDIDRYNPEDHVALLAGAMLSWPTRTPVTLGTIESLGERVASLTDEAVARHLAETLLDLLGRSDDAARTAPILARLEDLVEGALARGHLQDATALVEEIERLGRSAPDPLRVAIRGALDHLARIELLHSLASTLGTPGRDAIRDAVRLVRLLGPPAIRGLFEMLADEPVRARRRRVFDLLAAVGPEVVPEAIRWLGDPSWYVVRNVVALLRAVADRSSLGAVRRLTGHADLRVRLEALRTLLELDPAVGHRELLATLADPDPRIATAAAELAGQHGSADMVEPLLRVLAPWDLRGRRRSVRVAALHALGRIGRPEALPRLGRFLRDRWLPLVSSVERRAAYESLHGYAPDARAAWVARGLRSRDPEVRALCDRLARAGRGDDA
jgi:HEAT repeat protein